MRRFFVLFIALLLPLQVLDASFDDLALASALSSQTPTLRSAGGAATLLPVAADERLGDKSTQSNKKKPPVQHADLSDSIGSAALPAVTPYKPLALAVPQPFWLSTPIIPDYRPPKLAPAPVA